MKKITSSIKKISILGAGSWGTTLAVILSSNKHLKITLWSPFKDQVKMIIKTRRNKEYLGSTPIPKRVEVTGSLTGALDADLIIVAIPVAYLRKILKKVKRQSSNLDSKIFLSLTKGIEVESLKTASEIIKEELKVKKVAVLSGPTIASEVVKKIPTVATIASDNKDIALSIQHVFKGFNLRTYRSYDIKGTELAAAVKNVIAIACGIADGLGFGTNTKAALVTRGLVEITRLGKKTGASLMTFWGISGIGDLATTCFSPYSRNRFVGEEIGRGKKLQSVLKNMKMVAEGVGTVQSVWKLSKRYKIDMPITKQVYLVLYKNKDPLTAVKDLMSRPLKEE